MYVTPSFFFIIVIIINAIPSENRKHSEIYVQLLVLSWLVALTTYFVRRQNKQQFPDKDKERNDQKFMNGQLVTNEQIKKMIKK